MAENEMERAASRHGLTWRSWKNSARCNALTKTWPRSSVSRYARSSGRRQKPAFAAVMESGRAKGRLSVRRSLFAQASNGNTAASIFLAKNLLGYRDVRSNQHSGPDGGPIAIQNGLDLARLSPEDFEQLQALVDKVERFEGENK